MTEFNTKRYLEFMKFSVSEMTEIARFRKEHDGESQKAHPHYPLMTTPFLGDGELLKDAVYSVLLGYPIIFEGVKGTGKNTLCNTLAYLFQRPIYDFSFNSHTDKGDLVGEKTLTANKGATEVSFQIGDLVRAMEEGAFFIADEINMAHPGLIAMLHALTDSRQKLEVPGYGMVRPHPAFRFIGTMNYGYIGTQELNEAFGDRHIILHVEPLSAVHIADKLSTDFDLVMETASQVGQLYHDLHKAALNGEITSRPVSIRGLFHAVDMILAGRPWERAFEACLCAKAFDPLEKAKVRDILSTRFTDSTLWMTEEQREEAEKDRMKSVGGIDISEIPERRKS